MYEKLSRDTKLHLIYRADLHLVRRASQPPGIERETSYIVARPYRAEIVVERPYGPPFRRDVIVPAGMRTDLASVPFWGRWLVGRVGPHLEASILHDWLYIAWRHADDVRPTGWRRYFADRVMLAGMAAAGMGWRRWLVYGAVRIGGWIPFHARRDAAGDFESETEARHGERSADR